MSVDELTPTDDQVPMITRDTSTDPHPSTSNMNSSDTPQQAARNIILGPVDPTLPIVQPSQGYLDIPQVVVRTSGVEQEEKKDKEGLRVPGDEVENVENVERDTRRKTRPESYMTALTRLNTKDRDEVDDASEVLDDDGQKEVKDMNVIDRTDPTTTTTNVDITHLVPTTSNPNDLTSPQPLTHQEPPTDPRLNSQTRPSVVHNFPMIDDRTPTSTSTATTTVTKGQKEKEKTTSALKTWWKNFTLNSSPNPPVAHHSVTKKGRKTGEHEEDAAVVEQMGGERKGKVFARSLTESLRFASVQISTARLDGGLFVWGYVPVVVAKCGLYLKDTATEVPGTFRVSGSAKRMKELQAVFDHGPKYGKNLDWKKTSYTTHDVATILRRYLTRMPEPIVPYELYHDFRNNLLNCRAYDPTAPNSLADTIKTYQHLIAKMPKPNQYLLLYVLDLLSVFARKSEVNLMTAPNLAVIFQPGIISHTEHEMRPAEHTLSQAVLEFLIEHQDHFLVGMQLEPVASASSDAAGSSSEVFHPATSEVTPSIDREDQDVTVVTSSLASPTSPNLVAGQTLAPITSRVESSVPSASKSVAPVPTASTPNAATSSNPAAPSSSPAPMVPRAAAPVRADSDLMVPSDSDDEAPVGGYHVKSEDPSRLQASITGAGVVRSRTVTDRRSPRAIPIVQEYDSEPIERDDPKPMLTGIRAPGPLRPNIPSGSTGGGLRAALSVRRGPRSQRAVSNDKAPAIVSSSQKSPPGVIIVDNPPLHGGLEGTPSSGSRLFRRRTAPTRRNRNKDEEDAIRKQAEAAVKKLGTGTPTKKRDAAEG